MGWLRTSLWTIPALIGLFKVTIASADTITLIPTEDTTITEKDFSLTGGSGATLDSGTTGPNEGLKRNRALLKFDLATTIPSNAIVTSAALTLTLVQRPNSTSLWFSLHKLLQNWSEAAATWTNGLSPPAPWTSPGAVAPQDYASFASQSNLITTLGSSTFNSNPGIVADVQDWINNPANNFGWILICEDEELDKSVRKFASKESDIVTNIPSLEVQFTLSSPPIILALLPATNAVFQFQFNAESNTSYTVLYAADLVTTNWTSLTNIAPLSAASTILVSDPLFMDTNRFYRVRTP